MNDKKNENAVTYCTALKFNASDKELSPILINNMPYFVAVEVCEILELGNVSEACRRLDDDEKLTSLLMRSGQNREVNLVNESGLRASLTAKLIGGHAMMPDESQVKKLIA